jgi:cytochrome c oxidase subunit 2
MKDMTRATLAKLALTTIALTVVMSLIMVNIDWMGLDGSVEKGKIITLLNVMIVISSFVFNVVLVAMVYAIWKYRAKPGDESDGEPIHGNTKLEIIWTAIPTIIVIAAGIYSTIVLNDIEAEAADSMKVKVTAQQFAWRFDYVEEGVSSTELHVPVGTQLELELIAMDVIHSFWVPEWAIKRDLVPGTELPGGDHIDNIVRVTPDVEGTYQVVCAELCGWGHATMRAPAVVESEADFKSWISKQEETPADVLSTGAAGGKGAGVYDTGSE